MHKRFKKGLLAFALAFCMVAGSFSQFTVSASAEELTESTTESETNVDDSLTKTEEDSVADKTEESIVEESMENSEESVVKEESEESVADESNTESEEESSGEAKEESSSPQKEESKEESNEDEEDEEDPFDFEIPTDGSILIVTTGVNATALERNGNESPINRVEVDADSQYLIPASVPEKGLYTNGFGQVVMLDAEGNELDESYATVWTTDTGYSYVFHEGVAVAYVTDMMMLKAPTSANKMTYIGSVYSYTATGGHPAGGNMAGVFTSNFGNGVSYCGSVSLNIPMTGGIPSSISMGGMTLVNDANIRKVLYYGFRGPKEWQGYLTSQLNGNGYAIAGTAVGPDGGASINQFFNWNERQGAFYLATHDVLSSFNCGIERNLAMTSDFKAYIKNAPTPPSGFQVYVLRGASGVQDMYVWTNEPNGTLNLKKASINKTISDNHPCYSLEGTTYGIYTEKACTNKVGELVCDKNGNSNSIDLKAGVYWYKELKAGKGYILNTGVDSIEVKSGDTATITAYNIPGNDPLVITVNKENASGIADYDLSGTEFSIYYYNGYYNTVAEAEASGNPTRTWTIATQKKNGGYTAYLLDSYLVAGSDPLYKEGGMVTIPLGTIIVKETKAADGFNNDCILKDNNGVGGGDPYIAQIKQDAMLGISLVTTNGVKLDDTNNVNFGATDTRLRGDFEFNKVASAYNERLANVEFELEEISTGAKFRIVTDANGHYTSATDDTVWTGKEQKQAGLGHLDYGQYKLTELPCPANDGYELADPITFTINQNGAVFNIPLHRLYGLIF